ncbi:MAG: hypothetical protein IT176_15660 [Acidobacteria bacterium]|nr:hypothetical protein [Acidobacteriota bacterium]
MIPRAAVVLLAALTASCGVRTMRLPSGPGAPLPDADARALLAEATARCRDLRDLTAEAAVSGRVAGRRLRGRLLAGVDRAGSARLEAVAPFGRPFFVFVATAGRATLLLPRDNRVVIGAPPAAVLDAVAGLPLDGSDLFHVLTGCPPEAPLVRAAAFGDDWREIRLAGDRPHAVYLRRSGDEGAPWRVAADVADDAWRAEYRAYRSGMPHEARLSSAGPPESGSPRFDITIELSQIETNVALDERTWTVEIPPDAEPITLEELRRSGPLGPPSHG